MPRTREPAHLHEVTIVSTNPQTLDSLQTYLRGAGVSARCTREIDDCLTDAPEATVALILFPDDYRLESVLATLAGLADQRPRALPVVVTARPQRFDVLNAPEEVLIIPRPVWGWTLLDAIRASIDRRAAKGSARAR